MDSKPSGLEIVVAARVGTVGVLVVVGSNERDGSYETVGSELAEGLEVSVGSALVLGS